MRSPRYTLTGRDGEGQEACRLVVWSALDAVRTAAQWRRSAGLRVEIRPAVSDEIRSSLLRELAGVDQAGLVEAVSSP